uniref:Uncharacterized protein n=1 Tax=Arundo donax TaxID=35708 RepID=A0A0A9BEM0_ARUDO
MLLLAATRTCLSHPVPQRPSPETAPHLLHLPPLASHHCRCPVRLL